MRGNRALYSEKRQKLTANDANRCSNTAKTRIGVNTKTKISKRWTFVFTLCCCFITPSLRSGVAGRRDYTRRFAANSFGLSFVNFVVYMYLRSERFFSEHGYGDPARPKHPKCEALSGVDGRKRGCKLRGNVSEKLSPLA